MLDLGAAPGGWLQAAQQIVGNTGYVLGVDIQPIAKLHLSNVQTVIADITDGSAASKIQLISGSKFDVVLSDVAPNVSGVWDIDHAKQIDLARQALRIGEHVLRNSGNIVVKVFQGAELRDFELEMKPRFRSFRIVKPAASRPESAELYFVGLGYVG